MCKTFNMSSERARFNQLFLELSHAVLKPADGGQEPVTRRPGQLEPEQQPASHKGGGGVM